MKILMVCLGNICRSPLAQGILQHMIAAKKLPWQVDSAGTNGFHNGEAPHRLSQKVASLKGIDISSQVSRKITAKDLETYDIIYAMAADVLSDIEQLNDNLPNGKIKLFLNELPGHAGQDVPDPWYGGEEGYHDVYALIHDTCAAIIKKYSN